MSEYQYYEFRAVDKPLTSEQMKELRKYSARAEITPSGFKNEYHYGSFKGSERDWMDRYFDAHVYLSCWGTFTFILRLPIAALPDEVIAEYGCDESLVWRVTSDFIIISWLRADEDSYEEVFEDEGWMGRLLPIRDELLRNDYRSLYIGWLSAINPTESGDVDAADDDIDFIEPPVPPGLNSLTEAQQALAEFLTVSPDLIAAAAQNSRELPDAPSRENAEQWCAGLSDPELREAILRIVIEDGVGTVRELQRQFRRWHSHHEGLLKSPAPPKRTANELFALAEAEAKIRTSREKEEKEAARVKRLSTLVPRIPQMWQSAYELGKTTTASSYDQIRTLLLDIRDAAEFAVMSEDFELDLGIFLALHSSKALRARLEKAGVIPASSKLKLI